MKVRPVWSCVGVFLFNVFAWMVLAAVLALIVSQLSGCVMQPTPPPGEKAPNLCVCILARCECPAPACDCPKVQ